MVTHHQSIYIQAANILYQRGVEHGNATAFLAAADESGKQAAAQAENAAAKDLQDARQAFDEWCLDKLAAFRVNDINETSYHFYDDGEKEPIKGGEAPVVPLTISQMNRLGQEAITHDRFSPSQQPRPYLGFPILQEPQAAAYRGKMLVKPGSYRLISITEQVVWTAESLVEEGITDAGRPPHQRLANFRSLDRIERLKLAKCKGIIGVAHRDYHTLNKKSTKLHGGRVGDCMILVQWQDHVGDQSRLAGFSRASDCRLGNI